MGSCVVTINALRRRTISTSAQRSATPCCPTPLQRRPRAQSTGPGRMGAGGKREGSGRCRPQLGRAEGREWQAVRRSARVRRRRTPRTRASRAAAEGGAPARPCWLLAGVGSHPVRQYGGGCGERGAGCEAGDRPGACRRGVRHASDPHQSAPQMLGERRRGRSIPAAAVPPRGTGASNDTRHAPDPPWSTVAKEEADRTTPPRHRWRGEGGGEAGAKARRRGRRPRPRWTTKGGRAPPPNRTLLCGVGGCPASPASRCRGGRGGCAPPRRGLCSTPAAYTNEHADDVIWRVLRRATRALRRVCGMHSDVIADFMRKMWTMTGFDSHTDSVTFD